MKITVKPKVKEVPEINWRKLPEGTVVRFDDSVTAMVFCGRSEKPDLLLLNFMDGDSWLAEASDYKTVRIAEVLGVITEIVVE